MVFNPFIFRIPLFCLEQHTKGNISTVLYNPQFLEALCLASPVLYKEVDRFKNGKLKQEELLKFQVSVYKYYSRMCSRCTPFGLFAGCGIGEIGEKSKILPTQTGRHKSSTRLDMDFLGALIQNICKGTQFKEQLEYFPNTSLYQSGKNLRYTEYSYSKTRRKYVITEAESTSYLVEVLDKATCGASVTELTGLLVDEEITLDEAKEYIEELVDSQLLISELEPSVTGEDMLQQLLKKLRRIEGTNGIHTRLECVAENLKDIDQLPVGRPVKIYEEIKKKIEEFDTKFDEKFLFQSDLFIESEHASLGTQIISAAQKGIFALNRLSAKYENPLLKKFREDFYKKYEDEEIPLLQALDVETGVGFGNIDGQRGDINPLLEGIQFPGGHPVGQDIKIDMVQAILMKKYDEYLCNPDQKEIVINDDDLKNLKENWDDLPDTVSAMIEVIHTEECPDGPLVSMSQAGGSSAANLLGRFCYLDGKINSFVEQIVKKEQELNPDKILAEIVHLPESRLGNILMRPAFREYEIPYLANTSVDKEKIIPVTDLMVSVPQALCLQNEA
ncbi:MAG: hypothetical protein A2W89_13535 [Bacteroidetes bacterium GWE2_42_39]|nr:MAG: hypothetical protein A2W89_13535 [Bacteroidetes bacterium GWE2_42_39]